MIFVSPQPVVWHHIYQSLKAHWEAALKNAPPPPMVLVLSGWTMSSDFEKKDRWNATLAWAERNNCLHLIPVLNEDEKYYAEELSAYTPFYHEFKHHPKAAKPSSEELNNALKLLAENWSDILSPDFGINTKPISFSGTKAKELVVSYKPSYSPPWGSWVNHLANGKPSKFSELRSNVNKIIAPLAVDHITFKAEKE
jgi:hypothetical protein